MNLTPRIKLLASLSLLAAIPVAAGLRTLSGTAALWVSAAVLAGLGLAAWVIKQRGPRSSFGTSPRLSVVQRVGLSQRTGLTLIEVDGRPYVVVHGDGFARVRPVPRPRLLKRPALASVALTEEVAS